MSLSYDGRPPAPAPSGRGATPALPARYTTPAIVLHWLIALGIMTNVVLVWVVDSLPDDVQRPTINLHKSIGLTVLGLAVMRLLWRLTHTPPALPAGTRPWERASAHAAHVVLYVLIFALPLTGWIHDSAWKDAASHPLNLYGVIPWFRIGAIQSLPAATKEQVHALFSEIHESCGYVLYAVFAVHVAGALKHQFLDARPSLRRIWFG
jgi:cytochrome b561